MKENERIKRPKLNIQLFAVGEHVKLTEGEQAKFINSVQRKLGGTDQLPLEKYMAKDQTQKAAYSVFYVGGEVEARNRATNRNDNNNNFDDVKGVKAGQLIKSIRVTPTPLEVPLWVDDRDFDKSQLNEQGAISDMQVSAIFAGLDRRMSILLKDIVENQQRTVKTSNNENLIIKVPDENLFGTDQQPFEKQVKDFKRMMRRAKKFAKLQKKEIGIVVGDDGAAELMNCEKFTDKDFVTINGATPNQTGDPIEMICGGNVEDLYTFDEVFYPQGNETTGYMVIIIEGSFGRSNKKASINPIIEHVAWKKAYYMDVEVDNATELLQGEGVFIFKYKKDAE